MLNIKANEKQRFASILIRSKMQRFLEYLKINAEKAKYENLSSSKVHNKMQYVI